MEIADIESSLAYAGSRPESPERADIVFAARQAVQCSFVFLRASGTMTHYLPTKKQPPARCRRLGMSSCYGKVWARA